MLVATALTLIILLMFAQIFRSATATVTQQRGIGQNDARARMMNTVIRSDLQKMTFRDHGQSTSRGLLTLGIYDTSQPGYEPVDSNQRGYFYVAENDPAIDVDDVLQFTVDISQAGRNEDHPYLGRASPLGRPSTASTGVGVFNPEANTGNPDRDQPEFDDGNKANGAAQSKFAEVAYFIRNGTLYRRVMLIRDPLVPAVTTKDGQPRFQEAGPAQTLLPGDYNGNADKIPPVGDFWNDFDFSAYHDGTSVVFHGADSLVNHRSGTTRLADPRHRFGFQYRSDTDPLRYRNAGNPISGCNPVEYVSITATPRVFIGRPTHRETSATTLTWPGQATGNPLLRNDLALDPVTETLRNPGVAAAYDGDRIGEDILLTNVDAFDVKLWDAQVASGSPFVDVGGPNAVALATPANPYPYASTRFTGGNTFDTWHPENFHYGAPPYRPLIEPTPASPPTATGNWTANTAYTVGQRIFPFTVVNFGPDHMPGAAGVDDDMNGTVDDRAEAAAGVGDDFDDFDDGLYYEVTYAFDGDSDGQTRSSGSVPPFRRRYREPVMDNELVWTCFDNREGVPLIQIIIRYRDPQSNLSRQLTIRHSLTDRAE